MRILHLTLKKKWFDMILSGEKKEEYREIKKHWAVRLINPMCLCTWGDKVEIYKSDVFYTFKGFDVVKFTNGYAANAPSLLIECKGIEIGTAKPEWSDNWQGEVFKIKLGEILEYPTVPF